jgi:uncharacterized cupredoxin-like copper-binding protein
MRSLVPSSAILALGWLLAAGALAGACSGSAPSGPATPIIPGTSGAPREVNLITREYAFIPGSLDLVPGETVLLHVVNAGLVVHEAVIGDAAVQDAWEAAEAATAGAPPGPTPVVSVPPEVAGIRVVVQSGQRVDVSFTVPGDAVASNLAWLVGCHIPGHLDRGMQAPVAWISPPGEL